MTGIHASNLLPKIKGEVWFFKDKKNPDKEWWGWTITVFSKDANGLPVTFKKLESHQMGKKSRLWLSEEKAKKDLASMVETTEKILKNAFEGQARRRTLGIVSPRGAFE